jgi:hypothetical protein
MKALLDKTGGFGQRVRRELAALPEFARGATARLAGGAVLRQETEARNSRARARARSRALSEERGDSGRGPAAAQRGRRREAAESADGQVGRDRRSHRQA